MDRGVEEGDEQKVPTSLLVMFERDARTRSLVSSFMDMTRASAGRIIEEALHNKDLPQEARDALQGMADLEWSRGHAVLHLMTLASTLDANMKLLRWKGVLAFMELHNHLMQATCMYQLPFDQSGTQLFGEGLAGVLELNESYVSKRHTRQLDQVILKQLTAKGAKPRQAQSQGQQGKHPEKSRGKSKRTPSSSPAPGPKEDKPHSRKPDKGKTTSS